MRHLIVLLVTLGCRTDPAVDAWHGAVRIDAMTRADGACDAEAVESEPIAPYVFIAVVRDVPDTASLYWCETPEGCGAPFSNVFLRELGPKHISGDFGIAQTEEELCLVRWDDLTADQEGDQVDLVFRTGLVPVVGIPAEACVDAVDGTVGDVCDAVVSIRGTRVE